MMPDYCEFWRGWKLECAKSSTPNKEPWMTSQLPEYPWKVVGTDLFEIDGTHYLLTVDYFSRYQEVTKLTSTTSATVIAALKSTLSQHGIPEIVRSCSSVFFERICKNL